MPVTDESVQWSEEGISQWAAIIAACWTEDVEVRPSIKTVLGQLDDLHTSQAASLPPKRDIGTLAPADAKKV